MEGALFRKGGWRLNPWQLPQLTNMKKSGKKKFPDNLFLMSFIFSCELLKGLTLGQTPLGAKMSFYKVGIILNCGVFLLLLLFDW